MQDTPPCPTPLSFAVLHARFATLTNPRRAQGRRFSLAALLTLAVAAILANHLSVLAIAEWGRARDEQERRALGFTGDTMPHQTTLHRLFAHRADTALNAASLPALDMRQAITDNHGHGRTEHHTLIASTDLNDYLDWPGVAQVFMIERVWQEGSVAKQSLRYGITSLPPTVADAARLLMLTRDHWRIDNGLHHVKDVTLGEDRSQIRTGHGPDVVSGEEVVQGREDAGINLVHRAAAVVQPSPMTGRKDVTTDGTQHRAFIEQTRQEHPPDRGGVEPQSDDHFPCASRTR